MTVDWAALDRDLDGIPGTVSVWYAPVGATAPVHARQPDATHYAASTMKVAVLAALVRAGEAGRLDPAAPVPVVNDFASALPGAPRFGCATDYDNDAEVWARLGGTASLDWLARRMIVRSSNLATNIVLSHVGTAAVAEVWRLAGARHSVVHRGIEDHAARDAGLDNLVTARDLAALLSGIVRGAAGSADRAGGGSGVPPAGPVGCARMLETLVAQEHRRDLAAGLPPGTRVAHKSGWITGVRHGAGVVFPEDAAPYAICVCSTTPLATGNDGTDGACRVLARISATAWADRRRR